MQEKRIIVVYKSKTGFTKRYANWIKDELNCRIIPVEEFNATNMSSYDIIIFGGSLHTGKIIGINTLKNSLPTLPDKRIIVFAIGAMPPIEEEIKKVRKDNSLDDIDFFYFQGGLNYEKMGIMDRILMAGLKGFLRFKRNKTQMEQDTYEAIKSSYDHSSREQIKPLVEFVNAR